MLATHQLEDIFFVLYCYANKQAQLANDTENDREKLQWKQLSNLLDTACDLLEKIKQTVTDENYYLIY